MRNERQWKRNERKENIKIRGKARREGEGKEDPEAMGFREWRVGLAGRVRAGAGVGKGGRREEREDGGEESSAASGRPFFLVFPPPSRVSFRLLLSFF